MKTNRNESARLLAQVTHDAYSRSRYTDSAWMRIVKTLLENGASLAEARWVLESKHMRWAADHANRAHSATYADFSAYAKEHVGGFEGLITKARKEMDVPKLPSGADLAGSCEGEQIAQALDLLRVAANGGSIQNSAKLFLAEIAKRAGR